MHKKVKFQLALVTIIDEIYASIELFEFYFGIRGDVLAPLPWVVSDQVIGLNGEFFQSCRFYGWINAHELNAENGCCFSFLGLAISLGVLFHSESFIRPK